MAAERRYPSDLTDEQWELIEPLLPAPAGPAGRPPKHSKREIVNAILYINRAGCAWRMLPKDLPPWKTVYGYLHAWRKDGTVDRVHDALRERVRLKEGREHVEPTAGIIDSQSVKGADTVPAASRGYDAGKKINGRKRHIIVDTLGLLLVVAVSAACVQDRDGARPTLKRLALKLPSVAHIFADSAMQASWCRPSSVPGRSRLRSSKSASGRSALRSSRAAGWSSAPSPGCFAGGGCAATTNGYPRPTRRSSSGR